MTVTPVLLTIIATSFSILTVTISAWIATKIEIAKLQVKVLEIEKNFEYEKNYAHAEFQRMSGSLVKISDGINDIKLTLKDKADK